MDKTSYTIIQKHGLWGANLYRFQSLDSTNTWSMRNLKSLKNGDVVWTMRQLSGKGRLSRPWLIAEDKGLALSLILDFNKHEKWIHFLGQIAAIAVRNILDEFGMKAELKWPNDVMVNNRKMAGILSEINSSMSKVVVGIGLNINMDESIFITPIEY